MITVEQAGVGFVPLRSLIAGGFEEDATEFLLTLVKSSRADGTWRLHGLQRVQQVIHLNVILCSTFFDVYRPQMMGLKSVDITFMNSYWGMAIDDPLGHRGSHTTCMG